MLNTTDIFKIFYDEARIIANDDEEAQKLTNEAMAEFMGHYRTIKRRENRSIMNDTSLSA